MSNPFADADLLSLAETEVTVPLPADKVLPLLQSPPFVYVPGTFNTRDIGLVASTPGDAGSAPGNKLRPGFAFRSGALNALDDNGKAVLATKLGVRKVFDLRSQTEHATAPDPEVPGVAMVWKETGEKDATIPHIEDFVEGQGELGYEKMYLEVLELYQPALRAVLEHVRDEPEAPFLFHCTAGRDRTGVTSGLLLTLAGSDPDTVALDYLLSRVGTEPAREKLVAFARRGAGVESDDAPGFFNLCSLRRSCWDGFLVAVQRDYGGFDGYVTKTLGFSDGDLAKIKRNLQKQD